MQTLLKPGTARAAAGALLIAALAGACGKKGPLYPPESKSADQQAPQTPQKPAEQKK